MLRGGDGAGAALADGARAHDPVLHHDIGGAADQDQVLDIVAADEDQLAAGVNRQRIHHREAGQAAANGGAESAGGVSANQPDHDADQRQNDDQRDDELGDDRSVRPEDRFQHLTHRCASRRRR